jgi:membrane protease YdiL (CAAX protease family)
MTGTKRAGLATYVGLFCALGIPLLVLPTRLIPSLLHVSLTVWQGEALVWTLTAIVLGVLLLGERLPLSAIGLRWPTWQTLFWGVAGAIAVRIFATLALIAYAQVSGIPLAKSFAGNFDIILKLGSLPLATLMLLALRAAVTEEILFRGYGIERLSAVTGNRYLAAPVSLAIFTIAHLGVWTLNYAVVVLPAGLVLTVQYLWRRDLTANIIAHFITDATGFAGAYAIAHHLIHLKSGLH